MSLSKFKKKDVNISYYGYPSLFERDNSDKHKFRFKEIINYFFI